MFKQRVAEGLGSNQSAKKPAPDVEAASHPEEASGPIDVSLLLPIKSDEEFLREAYRRILGRECDIVGFVNYREMLQNHVPRRAIVHQLVSSPEARQTGRQFTNVQTQGFAALATRHKIAARVAAIYQGMARRGRDVLRALYFQRLEALDHKLDYLLGDLEVRSDRTSAKIDGALWTLSEKADLHYLNASQRERALLREHQDQVEGSLETLSAKLAGEHALLHEQQARVEGSLETLSAKLAGERALLHERQARAEGSLETLSEKLERERALLHKHLTGVEASLEALSAQVESQRVTGRLEQLETRIQNIERDVAELRGRVRAPVLRGGDDILVTEVDGFIIGIPGEEWRLAAYYAWRGLPEPGLTALFARMVKPGMVVVDVGAHIGLYTLYAARLLEGHGKVYSFEPTPDTFAILKDNVQVNGYLEQGTVVLRQCAVSDGPGIHPFRVYPDNSGYNTLFPNDTEGAELPVQTVSLDDALAGETRIDVAKIDAEGAEYLILTGMQGLIANSPNIHIFIEFAPGHLRRAGVDPQEFLDKIRHWGFDPRRVDDLTGELAQFRDEELVKCFSANLSLYKQARPEGPA